MKPRGPWLLVVLNCQKSNQCLKCQVSAHKSLGLLFEGVFGKFSAFSTWKRKEGPQAGKVSPCGWNMMNLSGRLIFLSYSLKYFPVSIKQTIEDYLLSSTLWRPIRSCDTVHPPVCHALIGQRCWCCVLIGRKMFTLRYVEAGRGLHRC